MTPPPGHLVLPTGVNVEALPNRAHYDATRDLWFIPVSGHATRELEQGWSEAVQMRIQDGQLVFRRPA